MAGENELFGRGRIVMVRRPVDGRWGIRRLFAALTSGTELGLTYDLLSREEIWVVTFSVQRKTMRILHVDEWGYSLITRVLYGRSLFRVMLDKGAMDTLRLTRGQLRRLVLDGTYEGEWQNAALERGRELYFPEGMRDC